MRRYSGNAEGSLTALPARIAAALPVLRLPRLPGPLGLLGAALPQYPGTAALALALNLLARNLFAEDEAAQLEGKVVSLEVRDAGLRLQLRIGRSGYAACDATAAADATVAADARDYLLIALGKADPDTLFFERRLAISGDTATGLLVKNALDRLSLPLPAPLVAFLRSHVA